MSKNQKLAPFGDRAHRQSRQRGQENLDCDLVRIAKMIITSANGAYIKLVEPSPGGLESLLQSSFFSMFISYGENI